MQSSASLPGEEMGERPFLHAVCRDGKAATGEKLHVAIIWERLEVWPWKDAHCTLMTCEYLHKQPGSVLSLRVCGRMLQHPSFHGDFKMSLPNPSSYMRPSKSWLCSRTFWFLTPKVGAYLLESEGCPAHVWDKSSDTVGCGKLISIKAINSKRQIIACKPAGNFKLAECMTSSLPGKRLGMPVVPSGTREGTISSRDLSVLCAYLVLCHPCPCTVWVGWVLTRSHAPWQNTHWGVWHQGTQTCSSLPWMSLAFDSDP